MSTDNDDIRGIAAGIAKDAPEVAEEPTAYTVQEREHYAQILSKELRVGHLRDKADIDKATASASKKVYEEAAAELCRLIRNGLEPQMTLPGMDEKADPWRDLPVSDLGLSDSLTKTLWLAELRTIGELSGYVKEFVEFDTIKGIGEKSAEKISEAFVRFWEAHPEYTEAEHPKPFPEPEDFEGPGDDEEEETPPDAAA